MAEGRRPPRIHADITPIEELSELMMWSQRAIVVLSAGASGLAMIACSGNSTGGSPEGGSAADSGIGADGASGDGGSPLEDAIATTDGAAESGSPADAGTTDTSTGASADGGGPSDGAADASCDGLPVVPDLTTGAWLICDAVDVNGRIWTGVLTITTETPVCGGATLAGGFSWLSTNEGTVQGTTQAQGSYVGFSRQITLVESQPSGGVISGTDVMTYDPGTDRLINGSWMPVDGMWSAAIRVGRDGGAGCPGDGG